MRTRRTARRRRLRAAATGQRATPRTPSPPCPLPIKAQQEPSARPRHSASPRLAFPRSQVVLMVCARVHRLVARANFTRMQTDVCSRRAPNLEKYAATLNKHKNPSSRKKAQRLRALPAMSVTCVAGTPRRYVRCRQAVRALPLRALPSATHVTPGLCLCLHAADTLRA
jgi:hypothetical protein